MKQKKRLEQLYHKMDNGIEYEAFINVFLIRKIYFTIKKIERQG